MTTARKAESKILKTVHKTVAGLHRIGLVDDAAMWEIDAMCFRSESDSRLLAENVGSESTSQ